MNTYDYLAFLNLAITCLIGSALFSVSTTEFAKGTNNGFKSPLMAALHKRRNPLLNILIALPIIACFMVIILLLALPLKLIPYNEQMFQEYFMAVAIVGIIIGHLVGKYLWQRWLSDI